MSAREQILAEIAALPDDKLREIQAFVQKHADTTKESTPGRKLTIMEKLRKIKINGPADFSENIDHYLSGEKRA